MFNRMKSQTFKSSYRISEIEINYSLIIDDWLINWVHRICRLSAHQQQWFFPGGSTQNRWILMGDFSKGGVHKTDGFWWGIFQRGEYTKPMAFDGFWNVFLLLLNVKRPGRLFQKIQWLTWPKRSWSKRHNNKLMGIRTWTSLLECFSPCY